MHAGESFPFLLPGSQARVQAPLHGMMPKDVAGTATAVKSRFPPWRWQHFPTILGLKDR
jgi:hypothetical protein